MGLPHLMVYTDDPGFGGTAHYNAAILRAFTEQGFRLTTVTPPGENPLLAEQNGLGVAQLFLSFDAIKDFSRSLQNDAEAEAIFARVKPDVILFSNNCPFSNFAARRVARRMGIPYLVVEAFVAPYLAKNFAQLVPELTEHYRSARAVAAVSQENLGLLRSMFGLAARAGRVIHYGRPEEFFQPRDVAARARVRTELGIPADAVVCVTTARLEPVKGYQFQFEAIDRLRRTAVWPRLHFVWVGSGSMEGEIRKALAQRGIEKQVHVLGQRWDVRDLLDGADVFILPSALEGMPLAIMEAMAKGLPVMASAVSGVPEELGTTGKLLTDPKVNAEALVGEMVHTVTQWAEDAGLRERLGAAAHARAREMFHVSLMVKRTRNAVEHALLPVRDYVSPAFEVVRPEGGFPNMATADVKNHPFPYLRREIPHNWYCDRRHPVIGFASRDEAAILYNTALAFQGKPALEIGCWMGWSACHLALGGVELDVIDPILENGEVRGSVEGSLRAAGVLERVHLHAGASPAVVEKVAAANGGKKWSLIFVDGDHAHPGPVNDVIAVLPYAAADAAILFHDLASPDVAVALDYLRDRGWKTVVYQTMQVMGAAYRGNVVLPEHVPDAGIEWPVPPHLAGYWISGMGVAATAAQAGGVQHHGTMASGAPIISFGKPAAAMTRLQVAEKLLAATDAETASMLKSNVAVMVEGSRKSGAIYGPLSPEEERLVNGLGERLQRNDARAILAGMLFRQAYQLPLPVRLEDVPDYLLEFYLEYLLFSPQIFLQLGEVERYREFFMSWVRYLHTGILNNAAAPRWQRICNSFFYQANFIPLYFTEANLREVYAQRGNILEATLKRAAVRAEYAFGPRRGGKIRLGILAQHFGPAPETFAALPVYEHLDSEMFEVTLYAPLKVNHRLEEYCAGRTKGLKFLPKELHEQVAAIRADDLDILYFATNVSVVLNNVTALAAHRLARHQTTSIASVTTTGLPMMDSYLSSRASDPAADAQTHYRERLVFVGDEREPIHCFSRGTEKETATYAPTREQLGVPSDALLFVSGANAYKMVPELQATWAKILGRVPGSRLLLYPYGVNWAATYPKEAFLRALGGFCAREGVDVKRLCLLDPPLEKTPNRDDILQFLKLADVYLDSYPFGGSTSVIDPLELGLPVVVRTSKDAALRSAMSAAILRSVGLEELVTETEESYVELAVGLAKDAQRRAELKGKILDVMQGNPSFLDTIGYGKKIAAALGSLVTG